MERIKTILFRWAAGGIGLFSFIWLCGCMQPFSKDVLATVERDRTFSAGMVNPEANIGSIVLWGGIIAEVIHGKGETRLLVIQNLLDEEGYPQTAATFGEFSAFTPESLDPQTFRKGTLVTIAGEIDRVEVKEQGLQKYPCPVLRVIEIHPWKERTRGIFPLTVGWQINQEDSSRSLLDGWSPKAFGGH